MPKGSLPTAFLSSTCYDLQQIRADLKDFFASLGFEPLLSEMASFPINPQATTIENCVNVVRERADIFILVVGARYGSLTTGGKSVTNLEYLAAKAKGIPIYVFVSKPIIAALPIWKDNLLGEFKNVVDTPELFAFVDQLRGSREHWVFPFEYAKDIIEVLREQFAHLFMDALLCRERLKGAKLPEYLSGLNGKSLELVFEKPLGWEFYLLAEVLRENIKNQENLKRDLGYGLTIGQTVRIEQPREVFRWISSKSNEMFPLIHSAEKLLNVSARDAMGPPGMPGDAEKIVYVARRLGEVYKAVLKWTIDFGLVEAGPEFKRLLRLYSRMSEEVISKIEQIPDVIILEIDKAADASRRGQSYVANMMFKFEAPDNRELYAEFERLRGVFG